MKKRTLKRIIQTAGILGFGACFYASNYHCDRASEISPKLDYALWVERIGGMAQEDTLKTRTLENLAISRQNILAKPEIKNEKTQREKHLDSSIIYGAFSIISLGIVGSARKISNYFIK